jgi:hypothetical protein
MALRRSSYGLKNGCASLVRATSCGNYLATSPRVGRIPKKYLVELKRPENAALLAELADIARNARVTFIYGAKDEKHNQALELKELLEAKIHKD